MRRSGGLFTAVVLSSLALAVPVVWALPSPSAAGSTQAAPSAPPQERRVPLMIVGDSISATAGRYARVATEEEPAVWWSTFLTRAESTGSRLQATDTASVVVDALPGSGFGPVSCTGRFVPFLDRLDQVRQARPEVLVVAGGRNDAFTCEDGAKVEASQSVVTQQVRAYFAALAQVAREVGLDPADVFVLTPWGSKRSEARQRVVPEVERIATSYGFSWISTPVMSVERAPDGTHPDGPGSAWLSDQVWAAGTLQERLRQLSPVSLVGPTPSVPTPDDEPGAGMQAVGSLPRLGRLSE